VLPRGGAMARARILPAWGVAAIVGPSAAVTIWWFLVFGAVAFVAPTSFEPGMLARIDAPGMIAWAIPESLIELHAYNLANDLADEVALEAALAATTWIAVADRQQIRVIRIDGAAAQVELLDGPYAGRLGWVPARRLNP
jgi:hypothetical protein